MAWLCGQAVVWIWAAGLVENNGSSPSHLFYFDLLSRHPDFTPTSPISIYVEPSAKKPTRTVRGITAAKRASGCTSIAGFNQCVRRRLLQSRRR
jgi:hypothetical protein